MAFYWIVVAFINDAVFDIRCLMFVFVFTKCYFDPQFCLQYCVLCLY
jgi:hypothetical protein